MISTPFATTGALARTALMLVVAVSLSACGSRPEPQKVTTGSITGKVSLADKPDAPDLAGSLVTLGTKLAVTNAQGAFRFDNIEAADVKLRVSRDGYVAQELTVTVHAEQTATADFVLAPPPVPNHAPVLSSVSVEPQQLKPNGTSSIVVVATDIDGDPLTFSFTADNGFTVAPANEPGNAVVTAPAELDAKGTVTVVVDDGKGGSATGKLEVSTSQNTQPMLSSVTATPSAVEPGKTIQLSAVASDVETSDLTYAWTAPTGWKVTGTGAKVSLLAPSQYGSSGLVTLEVLDGNGGKVSGQVTVATIPNEKPVVTSLTATPSQVAPNGTIALNVSAYDPHGDSLTFNWTAPTGWTLNGTGASVALTAPAQYGRTGTISVEIDDGHGGVVQSQVVVSTSQNRAPVLTSLTASPPTVQKGGTVQLDATATDADGDTLTYAWTAPAGWTLTPSGSRATLVAPNAPGQLGNVTLAVTDAHGGTVTGSIVVSTAVNNGPVISSITAARPTLAKGGNTQLTVSAADPDGDALTYAWTAPTGWTLTGTGSTVTITAPNAPGATGTVQVTVRDTTGAQASGSVVVSTAANAAPVVSSITASPRSVAKDGSITLTASASDADADTLTYAWNAPTGWTLSGTGASVTVRAPNTPGATGAVQLTVTDGFGGSTTGSVVVNTNANAAPVISSVTATPATVAKGGTAQLKVTASDADNDSLTYVWTAPAGWTVSGTGANVSVTAPNTPSSTAAVQVTVSDEFGGSITGSVVVSTRANSAPTVSSVTATPPQAAKNGSISIAVSASDVDGDSLTYTWVVPSGWVLTGTGASVSLKAPNTPNASGVVTVVVADAFGGSTTSQVSVATLPNNAPQIASLNGSPNPVFRGGSMSLLASANDADGDTLSYAWSVSGTGWTLTPNGPQASLAAPNAYAASAEVTLVVTDGFGGSATAKLPVSTSANRAPTIQNLSSSAMPILPGSSASVVVSAQDADSDPLTYAWSSSDADWTVSGNGASVTVTAPYTNDSTTTIVVSVSDGSGGTTTGSIILTSSTCPAGRMNCDGDPTNACETLMVRDPNNCGACGNVCSDPAMPYCFQSACTDAIVFSENLVQNLAPTPAQRQAWFDFRAALTGNFSSVTISGSADPVGVTCTGASANQLCQALKNGTYTNVSCDGRTWTVSDCGGVELSASGVCTCGANYVSRIELNDFNWGAANTTSCNPPTQTLTVSCGR